MADDIVLARLAHAGVTVERTDASGARWFVCDASGARVFEGWRRGHMPDPVTARAAREAFPLRRLPDR